MVRQKYGYAESGEIAATYGSHHIHSVIDEENDLENGMLVVLDGDIDVENRSIKTPTATDKVSLVLDVILPYDQSTTARQAEYYYCHEAGKPTRVYDLVENDKFPICDYLVTAPIAGAGKACEKGNYLVADENRKYKEVAAASFEADNVGFAAVIQDIEYKSNLTLYRLRVVKNG
ncbi:hypothetical protein AALA22_08890 [Anaerovoracaceae bacterium 41-7]